jgi:hypothetical protein
VRQHPPELLDLYRADVAFGPVGGEPDREVGGEPQDHVLVVAEPPGQAQAVAGDLAALSLVVGDALGDGAARYQALILASWSSQSRGWPAAQAAVAAALA